MGPMPVLMQGRRQWFVSAPGAITGRQLRYLLTTLLLEAGAPRSIRDLVLLCQREGVVFDGRPSKVISDALRWEIGWGRVNRVRRGVYQSVKPMIPRSTRQWIANRVSQIRVYLVVARSHGAERPHAPALSTFDLSTVRII